MRNRGWTDERLDRLRLMWQDGKTAAAIAAELGVSRSGVLGKIFRLRLGAKAGDKTKKSAKSKTNRQKRKSKRRARPVELTRRRGQSKEAAAPPTPAPGPKTLFELTNNCCRWPYQRPGTREFFFCGAADADLENGMPYCAHHMRRAYLIPPRSVAAELRAARQTMTGKRTVRAA